MSRWLITERTAPAWAAALALLDDGHWHPRAEVAQAMTEAAALAERTIANHLKSASARGWVNLRGDLVRLDDGDVIRQHLGGAR